VRSAVFTSVYRFSASHGKLNMEELLAQVVEAAKRASVIRPSDAERVMVETTAMVKPTARPVDSVV
jgi:IS5 family transposase